MMTQQFVRENLPYLRIVPEEDYHRAAREGEFVGSHQLADFRTCPRLYHKKMTGEIERTDSSAFQFGLALHKLALEGLWDGIFYRLLSADYVNFQPQPVIK